MYNIICFLRYIAYKTRRTILKQVRWVTTITIVLLIISFTYFPKVMAETITSDPDFIKIDRFIDSYVDASGIPGLSVGIVKDNEIVYLRSFGSADSKGRSVTPQTPFILGSTSKSFTALAIMQLVEEGKLGLDDPVQKYLPWFRVKDSEASSKITIRHLLNHTSGMSRNGAYSLISKYELNDLEKYIRKLRSVKLTQPVGTSYQYSNEGYQILGLIVESISGLTFGDYVSRNIFEPLRMEHSYSSKNDAKANGLAEGNRVIFGLPVTSDLMYPKAYIPIGYLISSSEDMCNYLICQMNEGAFEDKGIASAATINEMHQPAVKIDSKSYYGMGWVSGVTNGVYTIKHTGSVEDYSSYMAIIPKGNWGVIVLSNVNNVITDYKPVRSIAEGIISYLGGEQLPAINGSYIKSYILIDIIVLLVIIAILSRVVTIRQYTSNIKKKKLYRTTLYIIMVYFLLPTIILLGFPILSEFPWHFAVNYSPDIAWFLLLGSFLLILLGFLKLAICVFSIKKRYVKFNKKDSI